MIKVRSIDLISIFKYVSKKPREGTQPTPGFTLTLKPKLEYLVAYLCHVESLIKLKDLHPIG